MNNTINIALLPHITIETIQNAYESVNETMKRCNQKEEICYTVNDGVFLNIEMNEV